MKYTIIGGLNGVGKSTVYSMLSASEKSVLGKRVNVDEIASAYGGWRDGKAQILAGKHAIKSIKSYISMGCSFHQETTLAGRGIVNMVKTAKEAGFAVILWYIYVDNVEIAKQRVLARVRAGGHGVPPEVIERRSIALVETLKKITPLCDEAIFYNNTATFYPVAWIMGGETIFLDKNIPEHLMFLLDL